MNSPTKGCEFPVSSGGLLVWIWAVLGWKVVHNTYKGKVATKMGNLLNGENQERRKFSRARTTSSCVLYLDFQGVFALSNPRSALPRDGPFPWSFHPCPHLPHHLTPHSKRQRGAPPPRGLPSGALVLAPARGPSPAQRRLRGYSAARSLPPQRRLPKVTKP